MNILFLCPRWPFPIRKGDQVIVYHRLKELSKRHKITLVAFSANLPSQADIDAVAPFCEAMHLIRTRPLERALKVFRSGLDRSTPLQVTAYEATDADGLVQHLCASGKFDVIHTFLLRMAPYVLKYSERVVLELIDSMQLNFERQSSGKQPLWRRLLAREESTRLKGYETDLASKFKHVTVVAERDRASIGLDQVHVIPNGVDLALPAPGFRKNGRVIFTGNMSYHANVEAACWFVNEVWPLILRERPDAEFRIVGTAPSKNIRALSAFFGVVVTGDVPSIRAELCAASLAVAPMRSGSGIQNKVLEAMSCHLPVVGTTDARFGLPQATQDAITCADEPHEFAKAVIRYFNEPDLANAAGVKSSTAVRDHHSWESAAWQVEALYERAFQAGSIC